MAEDEKVWNQRITYLLNSGMDSGKIPEFCCFRIQWMPEKSGNHFETNKQIETNVKHGNMNETMTL